MDIKEMAKRMFHAFFIIFTGSILAMCASTALFFGYSGILLIVIFEVLVLSVVATLTMMVLYSREELSKRQMLVRYLIHFLIVSSIAVFAAAFWDWIYLSEPIEVALVVVLVIFVYAMVLPLDLYHGKRLAEKLTQKVKEQSDHSLDVDTV